MNYFKIFFLFKSKQKEFYVDEKEVIHMYLQIVKMKKTRPNLNEMSLLKKCFNIRPSIIDKIIKDYLLK